MFCFIFICITIKVNHILYVKNVIKLKTDVLLLADFSEKFISTCLEYYRLNFCHYFSSPGLSWNAMLKMTGIELEYISDNYMHLFEKGMRDC